MGDRRLLFAVHDVAPAFERQIDELINLAEPLVGARFAMLVVPEHWGSPPLRASTPFAAQLRKWAEAGIEMFLHGWTHRDTGGHTDIGAQLKARHMTAGEGEFLGLSAAEAERRIRAGQALIEDITGLPVRGFIAPAWLYGEGAHQALGACRIAMAEDHWRVWSPAEERQLLAGPVITWASRSPMRMRSSLLVARLARTLPMPPTIRVAVHPGDTTQPRIMSSIASTLKALRRTRRPAAYRDLLKAAVTVPGMGREAD